jgi:hypothetical protein
LIIDEMRVRPNLSRACHSRGAAICVLSTTKGHGAAYGRNQNVRKKTRFEQIVARRFSTDNRPAHNHQSPIINNQSRPLPTPN